MATRWHYQRLNVELGPVGFDELVRLVRAEGLGADDLVREEWNSEWRPAALAVGLFHMAGRQDLFDKWEAEQEERRRAEEEARQAEEAARGAAEARGEGIDFDPDEPAWMRRLREVEAQRRAQEVDERAAREEELLATKLSIDIDEATAAALAELEAREQAVQPTRLARWVGRFASPATLHRVFRWGLTLVVPNVAAAAILSWSEVEAQRYPSRAAAAAETRVFPIWGACDQQMYYFLLFDTMLFVGVAAYLVARLLESLTED
jgi:hypothetical protein